MQFPWRLWVFSPSPAAQGIPTEIIYILWNILLTLLKVCNQTRINWIFLPPRTHSSFGRGNVDFCTVLFQGFCSVLGARIFAEAQKRWSQGLGWLCSWLHQQASAWSGSPRCLGVPCLPWLYAHLLMRCVDIHGWAPVLMKGRRFWSISFTLAEKQSQYWSSVSDTPDDRKGEFKRI